MDVGVNTENWEKAIFTKIMAENSSKLKTRYPGMQTEKKHTQCLNFKISRRKPQDKEKKEGKDRLSTKD